MTDWTTKQIEKQLKSPSLPVEHIEPVLESMILSLSKRLDNIEFQLQTFSRLGPREPVFGSSKIG
jgi:endonuclease V-like protein UPF0215 family